MIKFICLLFLYLTLKFFQSFCCSVMGLPSPNLIILDIWVAFPVANSGSVGMVATCIPCTTECINQMKQGMTQGRKMRPAIEQRIKNIIFFRQAPSNRLSHQEAWRIKFHFCTGTWATRLISVAKFLIVSP